MDIYRGRPLKKETINERRFWRVVIIGRASLTEGRPETHGERSEEAEAGRGKKEGPKISSEPRN